MAADPLTQALITKLVQLGVLDDAAVDDMAARLDARDEPDAAHLARCALLRADEPSQAEWQAERRRARIRAVPDGGKD